MFRSSYFILALITCIAVYIPGYTQTDTIYYNGRQEKAPKKLAMYYRIYHKDGDLYRFKSYYFNDSLHMTGALSSMDPEIKHGFFKAYDSSGNVIFKASYVKDKLEGTVSLNVPGTGKRAFQITFENDIPNGETIIYDTSNSVISGRGDLVNGLREGPWTFFYKNSKDTFAKYNYTQGKRHGPFVWLHRSRNKMGEGKYENGDVVDSIIFYYDRAGVLGMKIPFYLGLANGVSRQFDSATGRVIKEGEYLDGRRIGKWLSFYADGKKKGVENYRNGVLDGEAEILYPSGTKMAWRLYKFGVPGGKQFSYYADGSTSIVEDFIANSGYQSYIHYDSATKKMLEKGEGRNGQKTGAWYSFVPGTDIVLRKQFYKEGRPDGDIFEYYKDGSKRVEGKYKNGKRVGEWQYYYMGSGAKWIKAYYNENGTLTGELLAYHENGELKRRELYDGAKLVEHKCYSSTGHDTAYTPLESKATFVGEVSTFVGNELVYPYVSRLQGIEGKVKVEFIVNEDGSVSDAMVVQSLNSECDEEALRIVNAMPKWIPAHTDGQPFRSTVSVPIVFWIPENAKGM